MDDLARRILTVIPCLNEERHLESLVARVVGASPPCVSHIVIVDGGSNDRTPEIAENLAHTHEVVSFLRNPARCQSSAVNQATAVHGANATYLLRIDAHADYPKNYIQTLLDEAERTGADSVVVAMRSMGSSFFQKAVAAAQNSRLGNGGSAHRLGVARGCWVDHGHHALMRLDAFRAVGGYDEGFAYNEDAELDYRLTQAGYSIWLTDKTHQIYYPRSSPVALFRQYVDYGYGRGRMLLKHRVWPKPRQLIPATLLPLMLGAFAAPFSAWAALPLGIWVTVCIGYGATIATRGNGFPSLLSGPAALVMHGGWTVGFWKALLTTLAKRNEWIASTNN